MNERKRERTMKRIREYRVGEGIVKMAFLVVVIALAGSTPANAEGTGNEIIIRGKASANPSGEAKARMLRVLETDDGKRMNLLAAFDGFSQLYKGYRESPILIRPKKEYVGSVYPENRVQRYGVPSLQEAYPAENNSVDDELIKTRMSAYQPLLRLVTDHLQDKRSDHVYINSLTTKMGNTNLTLAGLDKTITSVISNTLAHADRFVTMQLLKQNLWETKRLADGKHEHIYKDTDEALEYCLGKWGPQFGFDWGPNETDVPYEEYVDGLLKCDTDRKVQKICGPKPTPTEQKHLFSGEYEKGGGLFRWCTCCAETYGKKNRAYKKEGGGTGEEPWLLSEKLFGMKLPDPSGGNSPMIPVRTTGADERLARGGAAGKVKNLGKYFRHIYGDYEIKAENGKYTYVYKYPLNSISEVALAFREGCHCKTRGEPYMDLCKSEEIGHPCPVDGDIKHGICGALEIIVGEWEEILDLLRNHGQPDDTAVVRTATRQRTIEEYADIFAEASMGIPIGARDVMSMISLKYPSGMKSVKVGEITGEMRRVVTEFCDASSVAAYRSFHTKFRTAMLDHLTLNFRATEHEKSMVLNLVDREGTKLALGEMDARGNTMAAGVIQETLRHHDRARNAETAALAESNRLNNEGKSQKAGNVGFGGTTTNAGSWSGGGGCSSGNCGGECSDGSCENTCTTGLCSREVMELNAVTEQLSKGPNPIEEILRKLAP